MASSSTKATVAGLPEGAHIVPLAPFPRTAATVSRASAELIDLRARVLLPQTTARAQARIALLKRTYTGATYEAIHQGHTTTMKEVSRLRLVKSVRNVKAKNNTASGSASVVGSLCMPFSTCAALAPYPSSLSAGAAPTQSLVVTGSVDGLVTLWDVTSCRPLSSVSSCNGNQWGRVRSLAAHPTEPLFFSTTMFDRCISAWRVAPGAEETEMLEEEESAKARASMAGGNSSGSGSSALSLERSARVSVSNSTATSSGASSTNNNHIATINQLAVDPTGNLLASAGEDATMRLWDIRRCCETTSSSSPLTLPTPPRHLLTQDGYETVGGVRGVAFHPDGSLLSTADAGGRVVTWDTRTGACIFTTTTTASSSSAAASSPAKRNCAAHLSRATCVAWSPCGVRLASGGADTVLHLWDARMLSRSAEATAVAPFMCLGHEDVITSVSFYANPLPSAATGPLPVALVTTSLDHTVKVWDADTGLCARTLDTGAPVLAQCRPQASLSESSAGVSPAAVLTVGHSKYWSLWDVVAKGAVFEPVVHETAEEVEGVATSGSAPRQGGGSDDDDDADFDAEDEDENSDDEDELALLKKK